MGIVDEMKQSQADILEAIDGLTSSELTKKNAIGKWSARDVLLHIAMWDGEALKAFALWRAGYNYDWSSHVKRIQEINDFWQVNFNMLSAAGVVQLFNATRTALANDVSMVSDKTWKSCGGAPKWLNTIVIEHGSHHLEKLKEYRKSLCK